MQIVTKTEINAYPLLGRGKVRDMYEIDDKTLLIITTDRMSAFDVIMSRPVPYKGVVLNQISIFWMDKFRHLTANHLVERDVAKFPAALQPYRDQLEGRSVLVRKAKTLPVECIVRGYLSGSGWAEYKKSGTICGLPLPAGLVESDRLPQALFTPSTKAALGGHDQNISPAEAAKIMGSELAAQVEKLSLQIYTEARTFAESRGILIADTKFEFGMVDGQLTLIDEVLTPDSSRFWPASSYVPGKSQPSFDKQYLRDWLSAQPWDKTPPPPYLPDPLVDATRQKYVDACRILTGQDIFASQKN